MINDPIVVAQILAPIVSGISVIALYHYLGSEYLGADENPFWNTLRVILLSTGDSTVRAKLGVALTNSAKEDEKVGEISLSSQEFATLLESNGYAQGVLSGLKYRPADVNPNKSNYVSYEAGSMVFRESKSDVVPDALAVRQVHVFWFENGNGNIDVYAHEEYSSLNPLFAWQHYRGITQNSEKGKDAVKKLLKSNDIEIL